MSEGSAPVMPTGNGVSADSRGSSSTHASSNEVSSGNEQADSRGSSSTDYISPEEMASLSKRKVKHKVDGKEVELSIDEVLKGYSHGSAANKRFEEASALRKQAAQDKQSLESQLAQLKDPKAVRQVLKQYLGEDGFSNLAHETVAEALRRESMTPEELQAEEDRRELEDHRKSKKEQEESAKKTVRQQQVDKFTDDLTQDLSEFIQKTGKTAQPHELESLFGVMMNALEEGYDLPLDQAWQYVQKQESSRWERYLSSVDVANLPKDFVEKVRKQSVASLPFRAGQKAPVEQAVKQKVAETVDAKDFFSKMRK